MKGKNIEAFFDLLCDEDEVEYPVCFAYIGKEDDCHVVVFGDEAETPAMMLALLLEYYLDANEGATIEEYAESIKQELIRFHFEQGTER